MPILRTVVVALVTLLLTAAPAIAQIPPPPGQPPQANPWTARVMALLSIAVVCVAAFKTAKRTHQD